MFEITLKNSPFISHIREIQTRNHLLGRKIYWCYVQCVNLNYDIHMQLSFMKNFINFFFHYHI